MHGDPTTLDGIKDLADAARKPHWLKRPGEDVYDLIAPDGSRDLYHLPPRMTLATGITGFIAQLCDYSQGFDAESETRVFVGDTSIEAVFDDRGGRRDVLRMPLSKTASIAWLEEAADGYSMGQRDLEWLLRSDFAERVAPATLLPTVRKLRFKRNESGESDISHGRESMGRAIEMEVAGVESGDLPEEIVLQTSVYEAIASSEEPPVFPVRCAFRVNVDDGTFTIRPLEGEVVRAVSSANRYLAESIASKVEVFDTVFVFPASSDVRNRL